MTHTDLDLEVLRGILDKARTQSDGDESQQSKGVGPERSGSGFKLGVVTAVTTPFLNPLVPNDLCFYLSVFSPVHSTLLVH